MEEIKIRNKEGLHLVLNRETDPLFLFLDFDTRSESENMEFQHFHTYYEMMVLLEKSAGHIIEGQYYNLKEGDIVVMKPGVLHKSIYFGPEPTRRFIIRFSLDYLGNILNRTNAILSIFDSKCPIYRLPLQCRTELISKLFKMYDLRKNSPDYQELEVFSLFLIFLCDLYSHRDESNYTNEIFDQISHKIFSISSFIHNNYSSELRLEDIAEQFFISPCYLSRKFKEISGFSFVQYIQMTRIRNAQKMLLNTEESIQAISEECGFTSFSQFNRVFDKYCAMSPSVFRKKSKEGKVDLIRLDI